MKKVKFTEVFEDVTKYGRKIQTDGYLEEGKYPIIDQGQNEIAGYTNEEIGLFSNIPVIVFGDHTRIIKFVDTPFFLGADGVKVLKPIISNVDYNYLYYSLLNLKIPDTGYNRHFKWLKESEILLPSLEEQKAIAERLDKVSELIEKRKTQLEKLDLLIKSRFIEMFGDLESNPYGHPIKKLSDIASYWNGLTYKPEDVQDQGTIVLRSSNIQNSQLDFEDTVRVACRIREKQYVQNNDILMCSRNGSAKLVGKVALITNITEPMSFGAFMMIIRSDYYRYLMTYFQMDAFRNQIKTGATTTINQITGNMLNQVTLPVPDLSVVSQFAAFVEQIDKSKFEIQKSLAKLEILKKSLMQQYFG